jgi:hypothetical protein
MNNLALFLTDVKKKMYHFCWSVNYVAISDICFISLDISEPSTPSESETFPTSKRYGTLTVT